MRKWTLGERDFSKNSTLGERDFAQKVPLPAGHPCIQNILSAPGGGIQIGGRERRREGGREGRSGPSCIINDDDLSLNL